MAKATRQSTTRSIMEMIRRHRELYRQTDRLYELGGDDATDGPEYRAAILESMDLENRIVATRAKSRADIAAKWRFICQTDFLSDGDLQKLVEMILRLDVESVGASIPQLEAEGITAARMAAAA